MITQFDKANVSSIHREAAELLKPLEEKYGIKVIAAGGNFDGIKATLKFGFTITSEDGEKAQFAKDCVLLGCKPEDYGRIATINRVEVKLVGFDFARSKYPVRCRNTSDGKVLLYTRDVLAKYFHTGGTAE